MYSKCGMKNILRSYKLMTVNIKKKKNTLDFIRLVTNSILIIIFIVALLTRDIYGIPISKFLFIGISGLLFLINDKNFILAFICFIIPLSTGLSYTFIVAIGLFFILIRNKNNFSINLISILSFFSLILLEILSYFYGQFSIIDFFRFIPFLIIAIIIMSDKNEKYNHKFNINFFLLGYIVMTIDLLGQVFQHYSLSEVLTLGIRFGNTLQYFGADYVNQLVSLNPNTLGLFSSLTISICLLMYKNKNLIYLIIILYSIIFGIMCQSRSFIIVFLIIIILYIVFSSNNLRNSFNTVSLFLLTSFPIYLIATKIIPSYTSSFFDRFTEVKDLSNGRNDILMFYLESILNDFNKILTGVGIQNYNIKYNSIMSLHNATIEIIAIWGVVGFIIILALFRSFVKNATRDFNYKSNKIYFIPSISFIIAIQSGQGFSIYSNILILIVCYSSIRLGNLAPSNT